MTADASASFTVSAQAIQVSEGNPPAPVWKVRLTGTPPATGAVSVTVDVFDGGVLQSTVTFTLRVSEWAVGDVFVGVSTIFQGWQPDPPASVKGQYLVLRPASDSSSVTALPSVVTIPLTGVEFNFQGAAFGCAVDPYSGLLYTTDFDTKVNIIDSALGHAILQSLTTARVPKRAGVDPNPDPPTEDPNYISWQPESITFGVDRRFYVGHVGGLLSGSPFVSGVTQQDYASWELAIADDGVSTGNLFPLALRSPDDPYNQQLVAANAVPPGDVPNEPGWDYVLDYNDPQNPITDAPCLLEGQASAECPAPDAAHPDVGLSVPPNWAAAATPRRLSLTALVGGSGYEPVEIDPWGFLRSINGNQRRPVIQVVNNQPQRVQARRWWGKELHRFDSKSLASSPDYFETRYGAAGTDWIDLASDQRHLYYTSETNAIYVYDLGDPGNPAAPAQQASPFAAAVPGAIRLFALRLLPPGDGSGGILVAGNPSVFLVKIEPVPQPGGSIQMKVTVVRTFDIAGGGKDDDGFFGLAVAPDAQTFWTASQTTGKLYQFRIADGSLLQTVDISSLIDMTGRELRGLCVKLEYTAAREPCNGIDDDGDGVIDNDCLPVAFDDPGVSTLEDTSVVIDVLANDRPMPPPTATTPSCGSSCGLTPIVVAQPTCTINAQPLTPCGVLTPTTDGKFTYVPRPNFSGPVTFTYKLEQGAFESANVATVTITVTPVNDAPAAGGVTVSTNENTAAPVALTGNDIETASANLTYTVSQPPAHGTLSGSGSALTYTPAPGYFGPDSFIYTVTDRGDPDNCGTAGPTCAAPLTSAPATVTISVLPVNSPPVATPLTLATNEDTPVSVVLIGTDAETQPASLAYTIVQAPAHGTLTGTAPNLTYTPALHYLGPDSFTYTVTDLGNPDGCGTPSSSCAGALTSTPATVTIAVVPVNTPPVATPLTLATNEDTPVPAVLTGTDAETPSTSLTYAIVQAPAHGTLTGTAPNLTYTPALHYFGPDSFTYTVTDRGYPDGCGAPSPSCAGSLTSAPAAVMITVVPVNTPPIANAAAATTNLNTPVSIRLVGTDAETAAANLSFTITQPPAHGTLSGTAPNLTYTPASGYSGSDSFTYTVTDRGNPDGCTPPGPSCAGGATSAPATVTITIVANLPPVCSAATAQPGTIWPPNHQFVRIAIKGVTDPDRETITLKVTSIFQDEPTNTDGDGNHTPDGRGVGTATASVRAERSGTKTVPGNGRVYTISFSATDPEGASCIGVVTVCVPHDQGKQASCINDGPTYDSTRTWPALPGHDEDHCSVPGHDHRFSRWSLFWRWR